MMNFFYRLTILFGFFVQICISANARVNVTVLYESLCPDSIRFITKQLHPTYLKLSDYMNLELVPFGKARYLTYPWRISCQHGEHECRGNIMQACALDKFSSTEEKINFVNCVMSKRFPPAEGEKCAKALGYDYQGVEECAAGLKGRHLIAALGDRTAMFSKILSYVPTIIINDSSQMPKCQPKQRRFHSLSPDCINLDDEFNEETQKEALRNFKSVVCKNLENPEIEACQ